MCIRFEHFTTNENRTTTYSFILCWYLCNCEKLFEQCINVLWLIHRHLRVVDCSLACLPVVVVMLPAAAATLIHFLALNVGQVYWFAPSFSEWHASYGQSISLRCLWTNNQISQKDKASSTSASATWWKKILHSFIWLFLHQVGLNLAGWFPWVKAFEHWWPQT